ncbi:EamA family transporter RarD [Streptomyces sp. DSM 44917]|uniref:EamA family transporter RarD n=1 Tax=Streptomyces boetiae TaxID=3075541 RepID=A0ABU2LC46_9ACTN|nr:EamA family transporter RarD [Streptomyces sp. DSM 44917]MDT0309154.1 EamA family transporter RarD [Streptomyces sp. DSM 44917]
MWGLLPLYWHELEGTPAGEVLAHRVAWSLPTALLLLIAVRNWSWIRPLLRQPRRLALLAATASLITVNWYLFIWAVAEDRVLEASLGYFINPLLTIATGVLLLRERLRRPQWVAVGIGGLAVVVMAVAYGEVPWVSLTLSVTFALYGLAKKRTALDGLEGFTADTTLQFLPAAVFLVILAGRGDSTFTSEGPGHALLLAVSGVATALPLILFGAAAVRVPLSTIGLMQYIAPATMFLLGWLAFDEDMPAERWAGFLLVWAALCILTWDALRNAHRNRRATALAAGNALPGPAAEPSSRQPAALTD